MNFRDVFEFLQHPNAANSPKPLLGQSLWPFLPLKLRLMDEEQRFSDFVAILRCFDAVLWSLRAS
jgi:hypothetical protein